MLELIPRLSRRQLCASMLAAAAGIIVAGCSRRVGLNPELPTSQSPLKAPLTFPKASAGESLRRLIRLKVRSLLTGEGAQSGTHSVNARARSLMAAQVRWRATTITGGNPIWI
jgi:hypothetical protein